jgi:hypothetical protein
MWSVSCHASPVPGTQAATKYGGAPIIGLIRDSNEHDALLMTIDMLLGSGWAASNLEKPVQVSRESMNTELRPYFDLADRDGHAFVVNTWPKDSQPDAVPKVGISAPMESAYKAELAKEQIVIVLPEKQGQPVAAHVKTRFDPFAIQDDQALVKFLVTAHRLHGWVCVSVGSVRFKMVWAIQLGGIRSPAIEAKPPVLLPPHRDLVFPASETANKMQILTDSEFDRAKQKFIRTGLWYSSLLAGGSPIGIGERIYIVPENRLGSFVTELQTQGVSILEQLESFPDPLPGDLSKDFIILEDRPSKKWWQLWR